MAFERWWCKIETLKEIIRVLRNIGISIAGITFVVLMIKIGIDPDNKAKYIKLTKHLIIATILITLSLSLIEIPKNYFGDAVEITDGQISDITIGKIDDKDCQDREVVDIDGKKFVVTDTNVTLIANTKDSEIYRYDGNNVNTLNISEVVLENCSVLRPFSECQGFFKGFFAETKYFRDSEGIIFPNGYSYNEYRALKELGGGFR